MAEGEKQLHPDMLEAMKEALESNDIADMLLNYIRRDLNRTDFLMLLSYHDDGSWTVRRSRGDPVLTMGMLMKCYHVYQEKDKEGVQFDAEDQSSD